MSQIKSRNTKTELKLRKCARKNGFKNYKTKSRLPGKPDLYFPSQKIAVFIDGCFWHKCPKCFIKPKSNLDYWQKKIKNNMKRDKEINHALKKIGVRVLRFWEHEINKNTEQCFLKLRRVYEKNL